MEKLLISVQEAAHRLGVGKNRAYAWCRRGLLASARDGGRIYVPIRSVERLAELIQEGRWPA